MVGVARAIERDGSQAALAAAFDEIRTSEVRLRQVVDAVQHNIVVLGPDGGVVYANKTVFDYIGFTVEELMKSAFRKRVFHPKDLERLREIRRRGFGGTVPWENELRVQRAFFRSASRSIG